MPRPPDEGSEVFDEVAFWYLSNLREWSSWANFMHEVFYPCGRLRGKATSMYEVEKNIEELISKNIHRSGQLLQLPLMSHWSKDHEQDLRENIAKCAAQAILKVEMAVVTR